MNDVVGVPLQDVANHAVNGPGPGHLGALPQLLQERRGVAGQVFCYRETVGSGCSLLLYSILG